MTHLDDFLSPAEAATILGVQVNTLNCWRSTRRYDLPYYLAGRRVRYRRSDILQFLESRRVGATEVA